jgi:hypothetical protein
MLIIIGNGFDLNLGLKTSWSNFLHSDQFRSHAASNYTLFNYLQGSHDLNTWINVEEELAKYASKLDNYGASVDSFKQEFAVLSESLKEYLSENQVGETFSSITKTKSMHLIDKVQQILSKNIKPISVIDFNYTNSFKNLLYPLPPNMINPFSIKNIHGTYKGSDIIFGCENFGNAFPTRNMGFIIKSHANNYNGAELKTNLREESEIVIFGHSLGSTDHPYFKDFFMNLKNRTSPVLIKMFFHINGQALNEEMNIMSDYSLAEIKNNSNVTFDWINTHETSTDDFSLLTAREVPLVKTARY